MPSLLERGLSLLSERPAIRVMQDQYRGRYFEQPNYPALTAPEIEALSETARTLEIWLSPGQRAAAVGLLARLANHHRKARSAEEWQMLFEDYCDDLAEFSDAHVAEAIGEHRRQSNWFPTIAELRERCLELRQRDNFRLIRARGLLRG